MTLWKNGLTGVNRMTNKRAIEILRRMQEPEAWEPAITPEAFEALQMACTALKTSEKPNSSEPTAQPEIVRCGDCAWHGLRYFCHNFDCYGFDDDDFCSQGVKRRLEHD